MVAYIRSIKLQHFPKSVTDLTLIADFIGSLIIVDEWDTIFLASSHPRASCPRPSLLTVEVEEEDDEAEEEKKIIEHYHDDDNADIH